MSDSNHTLPRAKRLRRLRMALSTAFGWRRQGYFLPYRYADQTKDDRAPYKAIEALFAGHETAFSDLLAEVENHKAAFARMGGAAPEPRFNQSWFAPLDASIAYSLTRSMRPARVVEVGSGHSTRFVARALADAEITAEHLCIDPAPRAALDGLAVKWDRVVLSTAHLPLFAALEAGDIAFFDSSHLLVPGLDVDLIFNRILPILKPGVLVHIHDIFLPDPYPKSWEWRGYAEQNALPGWLLGGAFEPVFASAYAATRMAAYDRPVLAALPRADDALDSSLWMVKKAAP